MADDAIRRSRQCSISEVNMGIEIRLLIMFYFAIDNYGFYFLKTKHDK